MSQQITNRKRPLIGITMGDPAGIGPEIIAAALAEKNLYHICRPLILGDAPAMEKAMELKGAALKLNPVTTPDQGKYTPGVADILPLSSLTMKEIMGRRPLAATGKAMLDYINTGVDLCLEGKLDAIATAPITKTAIKMAGSEFHGHTELLAHRTDTEEYAMMMAGPRLKVVLTTIHIPLMEVPKALTIEKILKTIRITGDALKNRFGIPNPSIAVAGLNPHAGEDTLFGDQEVTLIRPAVEAAREEGFKVSDPLPPDTLFYKAAGGAWDGVVCMYHDQGLIPFKMIHFHDGVNTTLGLPIIRTSVDHGTAYDIAWQGRADHSSLKAAVEMAALQAVKSQTSS